jgi:hypothetical protein
VSGFLCPKINTFSILPLLDSMNFFWEESFLLIRTLPPLGYYTKYDEKVRNNINLEFFIVTNFIFPIPAFNNV